MSVELPLVIRICTDWFGPFWINNLASEPKLILELFTVRIEELDWDRVKDDPVAAPMFGVVRVGEVCKTTAPDPVEEEIEIVGVAPPEEARGKVAETKVTVPVVGVDQAGVPEARVRTWPSVPVASETRFFNASVRSSRLAVKEES